MQIVLHLFIVWPWTSAFLSLSLGSLPGPLGSWQGLSVRNVSCLAQGRPSTWWLSLSSSYAGRLWRVQTQHGLSRLTLSGLIHWCHIDFMMIMINNTFTFLECWALATRDITAVGSVHHGVRKAPSQFYHFVLFCFSVLPLESWVALDKPVTLSEPPFPCVRMSYRITVRDNAWEILSAVTIHSRYSIHIWYF